MIRGTGGTAISLYNTRNVMICGAACSAEGWTSQPVSSNRSCLQWLGVVDRGSASAENQMERSLSTSHLLPPFQSVLTRNYSPAHPDTQKEQHTLTHTHTRTYFCSLCQISDGETNIVKSWGRAWLPFLPRLLKLLGLRATHSSSIIITPWFTAQHLYFPSWTRLEPS